MKKVFAGFVAALTTLFLAFVLPVSAAQATSLTWSAPQTLPASGDPYKSFITTSPSGLATAVWSSSGDLVASRSVRGSAWSVPEKLSDNSIPQGLLSTSTGLTVVVWMDRSSGAVMVRTSTNGAPWTPAVQLRLGGSMENVALVLGGDDSLVVSWYSGLTGNRYVDTRTSADGITWTPAVTFDFGVDDINHDTFSVSSDASGVLTMCYSKLDGVGVVEAVTASPGGTWSSPTRLSTPGIDANYAKSSSGRSGWGLCSWIEQEQQGRRVMARVLRDSQWSDLMTLSVSGYNDRIIIGFSSVGSAVIAWMHNDTTIESRTSSDGSSWRPIKRTPTFDGRQTIPVSIALDSSESAVMTVEAYGDDGTDPGWAAIAPDGGAWARPVMLDPGNYGGVVVDTEGIFTTVYQHNRRGTTSLLSRTLNAPPQPTRPASLPNTGVDQPRLLGLSIFALLAFIGGAVLVTASRRRDGKNTPQAKG